MSTRPRIASHSSTNPLTADVLVPVHTPGLTLASFTLNWTGSPVGIFTVEACNDAQVLVTGDLVPNTGTWIALPFSDSAGDVVTSLAAGGADGSAFISLSQLAGGFLRLHYTFTSGTGTLTTTVSAKA